MTMQIGPAYQTSVKVPGELCGVGVHSGIKTAIRILPAPANHGIRFRRVDLAGRPVIPALAGHVVANELCTVIGLDGGVMVSTIEHLMAAFAAARIDNAMVEIDGAEMPIVDGCSAEFMVLLDSLGLEVLAAPRRLLRVVSGIRVERGDAFAEFVPYDGMRYDVTIDFPSRFIGRQQVVFDLTSGGFKRELARARTFGLLSEFELARSAGLCKGSSLENSVGVGETEVMAEGGLRWADEFVRHKALDAVGDLALAGLPFIGMFRSFKSGHRLNVDLVKALLATQFAYEIVTAGNEAVEPVEWTPLAISA